MDEPQTKEEEHVPECVEVKLAYDLAVIPVIGVIFFVILFFIIDKKLKYETEAKWFWIKKIQRRLWIYTGKPIFICICLCIAVAIILECWVLFLEEGHPHNDQYAQSLLKAIVSAQNSYMKKYNRYAPSLSPLVSESLFYGEGLQRCNAPGVDSLENSGFVFQMTAGREWTTTNFYVRCRPAFEYSGKNCYAIDADGRVVTTDPYQ